MTKTNERVTNKATKKELVNYLESLPKVKDKNLAERVEYALNQFNVDARKVDRKTLFELIGEVEKLIPAPVENSAKPKISKAKAVKAKDKKEEPEKKEEEVKTIPPMTNVGGDNQPSAIMFPLEIEHAELGLLTRASDKYTSLKEFKKAFEEGEQIIIAAYWSKTQIKQFGYGDDQDIKPPKDGFDHNLDLMSPIYLYENYDRMIATSIYTERMYTLVDEDFKYISDTDPRSGEGFKVRVALGMEFELYTFEPEKEETE